MSGSAPARIAAPSAIFSVCIASLKRAANQSSFEYRSASGPAGLRPHRALLCGDLEITGASPRRISGTFWLIATARSRAGAAGKRGQRAVEPAVGGADGLRQAIFQHVLPVEMRAIAVGRGDRLEHDQLAGGIALVQEGEAGCRPKVPSSANAPSAAPGAAMARSRCSPA